MLPAINTISLKDKSKQHLVKGEFKMSKLANALHNKTNMTLTENGAQLIQLVNQPFWIYMEWEVPFVLVQSGI